jgi:hypothetical protein
MSIGFSAITEVGLGAGFDADFGAEFLGGVAFARVVVSATRIVVVVALAVVTCLVETVLWRCWVALFEEVMPPTSPDEKQAMAPAAHSPLMLIGSRG